MHRLLVLPALVTCGSAPARPPTAGPAREPIELTYARSRNPCFPVRAPIVATEMWKHLEAYARFWFLGENDPPAQPRYYGVCRVDRNQITAPDGTLLAELGCGVRLEAPGIADRLGVEIGQRGQAVLDRRPRPVRPLTCRQDGPAEVRCQFQAADGRDEPFWYSVAGRLDEIEAWRDRETVTGEEARAFFAARPLSEIVVSVWCH